MGLFSWENTLTADTRSDRTVVIGNEDGADGQLWLYTGTKRSRGNAFDRAGLTNGANFVIDAVDESVDDDEELRETYGKDEPVEVDLSNVDWDQPGRAQNREAKAEGLSLNRIEDGVWDPRNRNDYYFITTEGGREAPGEGGPEGGEGTTPTGISGRDGGGVWRLSFEDVRHPELGAR